MASSTCDLPRDLLAYVLTFMETRERLLKTDMVSKAFREAGEHPMCWNTLLSLKSDHTVQSVVNLLLSHKHYKTSLFIHTKHLAHNSFCALSRLSHIHSIGLCDVTSGTLSQVLFWFNQLVDCFVALSRPTCANASYVVELPHLLHLRRLQIMIHGDAPNSIAIVNIDSQTPHIFPFSLTSQSRITLFRPLRFLFLSRD